MSVVYEVNLDINKSVEVEFKAWLKQHVAEMLTISGFQSAATCALCPLQRDKNLF